MKPTLIAVFAALSVLSSVQGAHALASFSSSPEFSMGVALPLGATDTMISLAILEETEETQGGGLTSIDSRADGIDGNDFLELLIEGSGDAFAVGDSASTLMRADGAFMVQNTNPTEVEVIISFAVSSEAIAEIDDPSTETASSWASLVVELTGASGGFPISYDFTSSVSPSGPGEVRDVENDDADSESFFIGAGDTVTISVALEAGGFAGVRAPRPSSDVPLPAAAPLLAFGVAGLAAADRRRRRGA